MFSSNSDAFEAVRNFTFLENDSLVISYVSSSTEADLQELEAYDFWTTAGKWIVGIVLSLTIFVSVVGNILVCLAICKSRRLRKRGNVFLGSLAVADLFVSLLVETFALVNDLTGRWIFGKQFCQIWIAFDVMCCTASILNLCAISLDRFIHIKDPLKYNRLVTKRVVIFGVTSIWMLSVLMSFVPVTLGWHKPKHYDGEDDQQCFLDLTPTYAMVSSSISFYLPSIIMVTLYTRLYIYATKHVKNIRALAKPLPRTTRSGSTNSATSLWRQKRDHKAAITLGIIMGTFLVCWFPFFCINVTTAFCKTCVSKFTFTGLTWLGYLNSALNPLIYSIFNSEFRKAFKRIFLSYGVSSCLLGNSDDRRGSDTSWLKWNGRRRSPSPTATEMTMLKADSTHLDS